MHSRTASKPETALIYRRTYSSMINRILIRTKVVQMLYSYLLTRTDFKILQQPESTSQDAVFAYKVYKDLLLMLVQFTNGKKTAKMPVAIAVDKKMLRSRVGAALAADDTIKEILFKDDNDLQVIAPEMQRLADNIAQSSAYKDYSKKRSPEIAFEVSMWITVFTTIIKRDRAFTAAIRSLERFTNKGFEQGFILFENTLTSYRDASMGYTSAKKDLALSLDKAYNLYCDIFCLIANLTKAQAENIENAKSKFLATQDELNPNMRFVDNSFVAKLLESPAFASYYEKNASGWTSDFSLVNDLLKEITASQYYTDYMEAESTVFELDCEVWRNLLRNVVFRSDALEEAIENESVFWNDDLNIMGTFVLKTIRYAQSHPDEPISLLDKYKDEEDATFGAELFDAAIEHRYEYRELINRFINNQNWEIERIPFMDIVIMITAITELVAYPNIPVAVTMNEYVELANNYSTSKSGQFVNGILYSVATYLKNNNVIYK